MPEPIINLQRRLTIAGAIRAGGEKPQRGVGKKLEAFRLTSPRRQLVEQAAELYGGSVSKWASPVGEEFQVYTEAEALPVLVMPSYSLRQTYELWEGATKRTRICDGIEEELSAGPCICNAEGVDKCDLYSRLVVALPELDSVLGWRLITRGANAAHEMPTQIALAQRIGGDFVPSWLRLDQRRGVKDGQVVRFVVPTLDVGRSYLALAGGGGANGLLALPAGEAARYFKAGAEEGYAFGAPEPEPVAVEASFATTPSVPLESEPEPAAVATAPPPEPEQESYSDRRQTAKLTVAQGKKLNVLVGKLRPVWITTASLYTAIAALRNLDPRVMEQALEESALSHGTDPPRDRDGVLHWHPLRDSLLRPEANTLIDWLEEKQRRVLVGEAEPVTKPEPEQGEGEAEKQQEPIPYDEFPEGY